MSESNNSQSPSAQTGPTVQNVVAVRSSGGWQIDRSVGLALILAIVTQCVVGIWYAAGAYSELSDHEKRLSHIELTIEERTKSRDEQMRLLTETLSDLRAKLAEVGAGVEFLKENRSSRR